MERLLERLGALCARRPWRTISAWLLMAAALLAVGQTAGSAFVNDFRVPNAESQEATDVAREHFPTFGVVNAQVVWRAPEGELDDPARAAAVQRMIAEIREQPDVAGVDDPFPSPDGEAAMVNVDYDKELGELDASHYERLREAAEPARDSGLDVEFRGMVVDLGTEPSTSGAEIVGVGTALVVLIVAFGSVVAAGLPLAVALVGIVVGTALVLLVGLVVDIPTSAPIVAVMLGLGAGIDYALFVLSRFRVELSHGHPPVKAAGHATAAAGHAVVFAGGTVVVAILGLMFAGIPFVGAMGVAGALTVGVMVVAAVTLLPALLGLLGHRVDSLPVPRLRHRGERRPAPDDENTMTYRWGSHVQRHRVKYAAGSTAVLLLLTVPVLGLRLGTPDDGIQPSELTQRQAYDLVAEHYGPGWNAPLVITVEGADAAGLDRLKGALEADEEAETVMPPAPSEDGEAAVVTVIPRHAPQDEQVGELVHRIRDDLAPRALGPAGGTAMVGGATAVVIDMADVVGERLPWVILAVVGAGMLLLYGMFRAPLVALKAAVMTLLSIGVSFGVIIAMFQWGWGLDLLGLDKTVPIMSAVPMLLFAVLFGLSMDYEVFLLSAVREAYDRDGDAQRAVVRGIGATARVITTAAIIMAVVFLSFVSVPETLIQMIGIGLATAVIMDATVIRMVLVPAVMSLMGDRAWWRPGARKAAGPERPGRTDEPEPAAAGEA
ncbi:MMPL family transporter [Streptomyces zhihengii]|uniref:MMPL family transporter n=1 Tax=Streptomyces zhihengii TaxID=1818004 RepID=UPI001FD50B8C|nr:MMPL family transporter [Streptomyces zhihengii]